MFVRYLAARAIKHSEESVYRVYITDALKMLTENTSLSERKYLTGRFFDLLHGGKRKEESAESIVERIRRAIEE